MDNIYGVFPDEQFDSYKKYLHNKIHWLLIYKDPKCKPNYVNVDLNKSFTSLQLQLNGLNSLLNYPAPLITLMTYIESAKNELNQEDFDFIKYRKLLLDAHSLVDKI